MLSEFLVTSSEQIGVAKKNLVKVLETIQAIAVVHLVKGRKGKCIFSEFFKS